MSSNRGCGGFIIVVTREIVMVANLLVSGRHPRRGRYVLSSCEKGKVKVLQEEVLE